MGDQPPAAPAPHFNWNGRAVRRLWVLAVVVLMMMLLLVQDGGHEVTKHHTGRFTRDDTSSKEGLALAGTALAALRD